MRRHSKIHLSRSGGRNRRPPSAPMSLRDPEKQRTRKARDHRKSQSCQSHLSRPARVREKTVRTVGLGGDLAILLDAVRVRARAWVPVWVRVLPQGWVRALRDQFRVLCLDMVPAGLQAKSARDWEYRPNQRRDECKATPLYMGSMERAEAEVAAGRGDRAETRRRFHSRLPEEAAAEAEKAGSEDKADGGSATLILRLHCKFAGPDGRFYDCQSAPSIICLVRALNQS